MTKMPIMVFLVLFGLLQGCMSGGAINSSQYRDIPAKDPRITFVRNQNNVGSTVITTISINDWVVGTLSPGEHLSVNYPPGLHQVSVKGKTVPLTFKANREYYVLIDQGEDGRIKHIRRVLAKDAALFMENKNYHSIR